MKKTMKAIVLAVALVSCIGWTTVFAAQQQAGTAQIKTQPNANQSIKKDGISPAGKVRAKSPVCTILSNQINKDKAQLRDVLRYMNEYDCNGAGAGSTQCTSLETKKTNLEARISENVRTARDRGCTT